jgi:hypothetical protein
MVGIVKDVLVVEDFDVPVVWNAMTLEDCTEGDIAVCLESSVVEVFVEVDGPFGYSARVDFITDCNVKATAVHGGSSLVVGVLVYVVMVGALQKGDKLR